MEFDNWKWDELQYSNKNFTINGSIRRIIQPFPSDDILARFARIVYSDNYSKEEEYKIPDGWELLTTARNDKAKNGYFGAAFWNPLMRQIVISHRGTKLTNVGALKTDAELAFNKKRIRQAHSAATFTHTIRQQCELKRNSDIQLSITGHSLGAWLAQVTTFTIKYMRCTNKKHFEKDDDYLNNIYPHTVVFESPGCRPVLAQLIGRYAQGSYGNYRSLDMTVYLSQQNPINSVNEHVGTIYCIPIKTHSINKICEFLDPNNSNEQKQILVDFPSGKFTSMKSFLRMIPIVSYAVSEALPKTIEYRSSTCSLNVFDEYELKFLKMWNNISDDTLQKFKGLEDIKKELKLLSFKIDEDTHTIEANNKLSETIANIKFKKYKDDVIYNIFKQDMELAQQDTEHAGYLEILKMESDLFLKELDKFEPHYFKDLYGIEKFLNDGKNTLCIGLKEQDEYNVDASIINNILNQLKTCLQKNKYIYITSSSINKNPVAVLNKFDLLITGNFNDEPDDKYITNFLSDQQINAKKIVLTSNTFINNLKESNIQKSDGYGHKIVLKHLQDKSAEELLKRKNLKFHSKQFSLLDIVMESSANEENYNKLDNLLNHTILLEFLTTKTEYVYEISTQISNFQQCVVYHNTYCQVTVDHLKKIISKNSQNLYVIQCNDDELIKEIASIADNNVFIKKTDDFEKMCYQNPDKVVYWFVLEKSTLHLEKYYSKEFYMSRVLEHKKILKDSIIELIKSKPVCFLFCKKYEDIKTEMPVLEGNKRSKYVANESIAVNISKGMDQAHILTVENGKIIWLRSNKHTYLMDYVSEESNAITETDFTKLKDKLVIICGPAGSGKSAYVANLQQKLHQTSDDAWVFSISLKTCKIKLKELNHNGNVHTIAECILNMSYMPFNDFTTQMLVYCLKNETKLKVHLLFDGFDELRDDDIEQKFVEMVSFLDHSTRANILITSRTYKSRYLENSLSTIASHLKEIEEGDIVDYLSSCWYTKLSVINSNVNKKQLKNFAAKLLEQAVTTIGESVSEFIGSPMHMQLIGEVIEPDQSTDPYEQINVSNILELYTKLVDNRYRIYFKKHMQIDDDRAIYLKWLSDMISRKHSILAVSKVFHINTPYINMDDIEELNSVGFIQSNPYYQENEETYNCDSFEFSHSSLENYFIADILVRWLTQGFDVYPKLPNDLKIENFFIDSLLLKPDYRAIRFFINAQLQRNNENNEISNDQLKLCVDTWKKTENDPKYMDNVKNNDDTLFHVCVRENLFNLVKKLLMSLIECHGTGDDENSEQSNEQLVKKITNIFTDRNQDDETILFLAVDNESRNLVQILLDCISRLPTDNIKKILYATFFKCSTEKRHLQAIQRFISTSDGDQVKMKEVLLEIEDHLPLIDPFLQYLVTCETKIGQQDKIKINIKNKNQAIAYLMEYLKGSEDVNTLKLNTDEIFRSYLLETRNQYKETPLHIAAKRKDFYLTKIYILLGCNLNKRDYHGMTPLARATKFGHKEIVELLVNTDGVRHIGDDNYISPLAHAAKQGHLEITKCLVKILQLDVIQRDMFHMIPLTWAAQKGHKEIVVYLLSKNEESIDHVDCYGKTPLSHALKLENDPSNIAKYLLDKGASIDIPDRYGTTPLEYCLKKKKYDLINSLIDRGANVKFEYIKHISVEKSGLINKLIRNINQDKLSQKQLQELENIKEKLNSVKKKKVKK